MLYFFRLDFKSKCIGQLKFVHLESVTVKCTSELNSECAGFALCLIIGLFVDFVSILETKIATLHYYVALALCSSL